MVLSRWTNLRFQGKISQSLAIRYRTGYNYAEKEKHYAEFHESHLKEEAG